MLIANARIAEDARIGSLQSEAHVLNILAANAAVLSAATADVRLFPMLNIILATVYEVSGDEDLTFPVLPKPYGSEELFRIIQDTLVEN